jgi:hypothetical protein
LAKNRSNYHQAIFCSKTILTAYRKVAFQKHPKELLQKNAKPCQANQKPSRYFCQTVIQKESEPQASQAEQSKLLTYLVKESITLAAKTASPHLAFMSWQQIRKTALSPKFTLAKPKTSSSA